MKLTKKQKLNAYTYALLCSLSNKDVREFSTGVCDLLNGFCYIDVSHYFGEHLHSFTEFEKQKPKKINWNYYPFWWTGKPLDYPKSHVRRISAICRAINLTEKLKK